MSASTLKAADELIRALSQDVRLGDLQPHLSLTPSTPPAITDASLYCPCKPHGQVCASVLTPAFETKVGDTATKVTLGVCQSCTMFALFQPSGLDAPPTRDVMNSAIDASGLADDNHRRQLATSYTADAMSTDTVDSIMGGDMRRVLTK